MVYHNNHDIRYIVPSLNGSEGLIAIWGESQVQEKLDSVTRNKVIYEDIAKMNAQGYDYDWKQKAKNLAHVYCKVKCLSVNVIV